MGMQRAIAIPRWLWADCNLRLWQLPEKDFPTAGINLTRYFPRKNSIFLRMRRSSTAGESFDFRLVAGKLPGKVESGKEITMIHVNRFI